MYYDEAQTQSQSLRSSDASETHAFVAPLRMCAILIWDTHAALTAFVGNLSQMKARASDARLTHASSIIAHLTADNDNNANLNGIFYRLLPLMLPCLKNGNGNAALARQTKCDAYMRASRLRVGCFRAASVPILHDIVTHATEASTRSCPIVCQCHG